MARIGSSEVVVGNQVGRSVSVAKTKKAADFRKPEGAKRECVRDRETRLSESGA